MEHVDRVIRIAPALREHVQIPDMVEVHGNTIGECLEDLITQYPDIRSSLFNRNDLLRVLVCINNEEILTPYIESNLDRTLDPADEIQILAILAEG